MTDLVYIPAGRLNEIAAALLEAGGFTHDESEITAQSLIRSNLLGYDSHGVVRVAEYINSLKNGRTISAAPLKILRDTSNSLHVDAKLGLGQVQMPRFLDLLVEKAKINGSVTGAMCGSGHIGRLGEWTDALASEGYAAFLAVNDNGYYNFVAPPGGLAGRTSTNPVSFAIPLHDSQTFMIDMSTSATAMGKVRLASLAGTSLPEGTLQDSAGQPTTDPSVMMNTPPGALLPMGGAEGYKGFGLSMIVDLLVAGLSGGFTPPATTSDTNNVVITIWNPRYFAGFHHMADEARKYLDYLRATPLIDEAAPIRLSGDASRAEKNRREKSGIPLTPSVCKILMRSTELTKYPLPEEFKGLNL